jgi:hypothetical protein
MKGLVYVLIGLLAIGSVVALTDYRQTSYSENKYAGARSLQEYDEGCPKLMVHPGYYVQQVYVRTSDGFKCQYPSRNKIVPAEVVPPPVVVPVVVEPVCEEKKVCELVCDRYVWFFGHRICVDWDKECKVVEVCED